MIIERIELNQYRNYENLRFRPHPGINLFYGKNGSGKTNLLEAIHYCALGKSHRITQDLHAVMAGKKEGSCMVAVQGKMVRNEVRICLQSGENAVKTVYVDGKKIRRLSEMMGVLRCVIFSPEDLELIKGGPAVRRRFLDMMISQISQPYFIALQQYRLAMEQRNAILKNAKIRMCRPDPMIIDFEKAMSGQAALIWRERKKATEFLSEEGFRIYRKISGNEEETLQITYHGFMKNENQSEEDFQHMLAENREEDLRQGMTTAGPHRDDLYLTLNHKNMKQFASQGQIRTAALSMKLGQLRMLTVNSGETPVLLLDDVMSELDLQRRMNLLSEIGDAQTFITFSDEGDLDKSQKYRTCFVYSEHGKAYLEEQKAGPETEPVIMKEPDFS